LFSIKGEMGQEGIARERTKGKGKGRKKVRVEKKRTPQLLQRLITRQLVAFSDLIRVQAHYEEVFRSLEELGRKYYDCFRTVADLGEMGD
jgi:hypothetical protein